MSFFEHQPHYPNSQLSQSNWVELLHRSKNINWSKESQFLPYIYIQKFKLNNMIKYLKNGKKPFL